MVKKDNDNADIVHEAISDSVVSELEVAEKEVVPEKNPGAVRFYSLPDIEFVVYDLKDKEICRVTGRAAQDYIINSDRYIVRTASGMLVGLA